jgi:phosphatidylglycerophosphate synthase
MTPGLRQVFASYQPKFRHELRTEWAVALLYRPVSLLFTPLFAALGIAPTHITLLGLLCALALPWLATFGGADAATWVGLLGVTFCVLDCLDGNVARATGRVSRLGAYADFVTDIVYRGALYAAIGILADASSSAPTIAHAGLALGLLSALLALTARACRLYLEAGAHHPAPEADEPRLNASGLAFAFVSGLDHLTPILLIVCGLSGHLSELLIYLLAYSLADLIATQASAARHLR